MLHSTGGRLIIEGIEIKSIGVHFRMVLSTQRSYILFLFLGLTVLTKLYLVVATTVPEMVSSIVAGGVFLVGWGLFYRFESE